MSDPAVNYRVREIAAKLEFVQHTSVVGWQTMLRRQSGQCDAVEVALQESARAIAGHIADRLVKEPSTRDVRATDDRVGHVLTMRAYAFSRESLLRLLDDVYIAGQQDGRLHNYTINTR